MYITNKMLRLRPIQQNSNNTEPNIVIPPSQNNTGRVLTLNPGTQQVMKNVGPTAEAYKRYDHRTHVYMKPDTYIGADERMSREEWLFDVQNKRMVNATIDFTPGCERLYLEILTNASDNVGRSRRAGIDPGHIDIIMNNSTISITNYGLPIPIEIHPVEKVYVPEMIFGSLLTSSNYEVERHEAGTNGIGAKATNIFSTEFMVIVNDHIRHLKYTQVWNENMKHRGEPVIEQYGGKASSVQIVYKMDFERFRYEVPIGNGGGYPVEAYTLFARHAVDISFTAKTTVTFNGYEFNYANIREYARLYFGDTVDSAIVYYQWPVGTEIVKKKKGYQVARDPAITPLIELIAIDTPDEGHHVSFVNCMMTRDGGVHVNAAVKAVGENAVRMINDNVIKRLTKQNKGKELDAKEKRAHTITINDVKPHISILLSAKVTNPKFTSQTKTMLHSPVPKIDISEDELKGITRWQLIDRLYAALEAKQFASMSKNDGKLRRYIKLLKGIDANNAGKAQRHQCILYITEGKSGAGYANKLVGLVSGGRDNIGVLPMRGKSLNVMNADRFQIEKNAEINELMKMLGLKYCPDPKFKDTYYLDQTNFDKLRYGAIMIMADSDVDGKHIIGLILNFFYCFFPSLLARGFVMYYRTPTLRVTFNRQIIKFYTQREYDEWKLVTPNYQNWKHKYYKGLGTSNDSEIKDDFKSPRVVKCFYDENAPYAMKLAFDKQLSDRRKDWLGQWRSTDGLGIDDIEMQPISWFINYELILFSIADTQRSIPKLTDGFKESHRKILHGAHLRWKISDKAKEYPESKVAQFGAFVADKSNYHHGEVILDDVVVGMAQDFVGSNNISWFTKDGQFGCFDPNTLILLWDGSKKLAKDITTEDILIGDDGEKRHISKVVSGRDEMYDIVQSYGETYRVNSQHILTLYYPEHKAIYWDNASNKWYMEYFDIKEQCIKSKEFNVTKTRTKQEAEQLLLQFANTIPDNDKIFDINLQTYLSFSPTTQKLFKSVHNFTPIKWPKREIPVDPYIFGTWLVGDKYQDCDIKHIPEYYIINDEETRLQLLAGMIDADGTLTKSDGVENFEIYAPSHIIDSLEYIANSLGFKTSVNVQSDSVFKRLFIGGDIHRIPTQLPRKQSSRQTKFIGSSIDIKHIGRGDYVGWYIDGNERFFLSDWTLVHNTRFQGGKDAAQTRYSYVRPEKLVGYILRKEDRPILQYVVDEGDKVEPETYYPIIPMILVNGGQGIGTGYSTFIPCHNPLDIINWLRLKLNGVSNNNLPDVLPWYRGFKGTIRVIDRRKRNNKTITTNDTCIPVPHFGESPILESEINIEDEKLPGEDDYYGGIEIKDDTRQLLSMISLGNFYINNEGTIVIDELPIGRWPMTYHKWLEDLVESKKITGFRDCSVDDKVYFEIYGFTDNADYRTLKLQRTKGMSNMVLLDDNNRPVRYDTSFEILEAFYVRRLPIYQRRKDYILEHLLSEIEVLNHKIRFIQAVLNKELRFINRKKTTIYETLDRLGIPREIYDKSMNHHLSEDDITELTHKIQLKQEEYNIVNQTTPEQMWNRDLDELENAYRSVYKLPKNMLKLAISPDTPSQNTTPNISLPKPTRLNLRSQP